MPKPANLRNLKRAAADLAAAREAFEAELLKAAAAGASSRAMGKAAGMSHQGVRRIIAQRAPAPRNSEPAPKPAPDANEVALQARLAELDGRWDKLVDRLAPKFEPTDPRREQLHRNQVNGRIRKAESGRNRDGSVRGTVGKGRGVRVMPTVKNEMRACAEAEILRAILNHPDDPFFVRLNAELDESRQLRVQLDQLAEARCGF